MHAWPVRKRMTFVCLSTVQKLKSRRFMTGALPGSLEAFLALRGIRTLPVRLQQHQRSALIIAQRLEGHAAVERVLFPGTVQ